LVKLSGENKIEHNAIRDMYYTGISVGWDWGFHDTAAHDNLVLDNDISDIGQNQLSDMGGIYVLGKQPGSRIAGNRIRHVSARGYGGWGIYLDEGSTSWTVENNVVGDTKTGGFHIHYGGNNLIRNNVFAHAKLEGQLIRSRDDQQGPIRFEHNLIVADPGEAPLVVPSWLKRDVVMTGNLYAVPKTNLPFGDDGTGRFVATTLNADGLPPKGSAVYAMGFLPIDLSGVGPRRR
jgi:parallel beta-helix repeat protein